jgi:hypothetical protein
MTSIERRLLDELEIQKLTAAYSHAVMRRDGVAAAAVYAADGVLPFTPRTSLAVRPSPMS